MTKEVMIFARGKWEFARQEWNDSTKKQQWIRRDTSWICYVGDEKAIQPIPQKPK